MAQPDKQTAMNRAASASVTGLDRASPPMPVARAKRSSFSAHFSSRHS